MLLQRILPLVALTHGDPSRPTTDVGVQASLPLPTLCLSLGLEAYTAALRAEDIVTAQDLLLLRMTDMADLGLSIGARNRLVHWQQQQHRQQQQQQQQRPGQAQQPLPPAVGARANPAYNLTFDVRLYGADPNANCCAEAAIQAAINASGQNYAGDYNCGEGCATWGPPVVFPHGQYAINSTLTPAGVMRGEGNAMIRMLDPSKDIFYSAFTWRRKRTHPQPPSPTHAAPTYVHADGCSSDREPSLPRRAEPAPPRHQRHRLRLLGRA